MKLLAQVGGHRFDHIFLPKKAMPSTRSEIAHTQVRNAAQPLNLAPQFRFGARVKNVQAELAAASSVAPGFSARQESPAHTVPTSWSRSTGPRNVR